MAAVVEESGLVIRCEARGFRFDVHGDVELRAVLAELFAALQRSGGRASAIFSLAREAGEGSPWHVRMDGKLMMGSGRLGEALHGLIVHINQRVLSASDNLLCIHAAAVATPEGAVLLPGGSGSGKTTLCARLLQHGAGYLSDDSVALEHSQRVLGYPKPLGFKGGTWEQFADPDLGDLNFDQGRQDVWQIPPNRLGGSIVTSADPVAVVLPRFESGAELRLVPITPRAAATALVEQTQNLLSFGVPRALEIIGGLAARAACYAVVYGDAREAAPPVLDLIRLPLGAPAS
ncbi:MAG TPA: hypothetical protein VG795_12335, partial [Acidimicrobiia bacterium]|nr:hypothetical protein [Acidimicrobiia bacterium]